jgi:hypothetical protein
MRGQAQQILEETEAAQAQAQAEFGIWLAARREEAERQEAERLAAAHAVIQKLITEAERRAATAEQRAATASAQAEQSRREADRHSSQLVSSARNNAGQIVAQATAQAGQLRAASGTEIERLRGAAQRELAELTSRKETISGHLDQIRQLLGMQPAARGEPPATPLQPAADGGKLSSPVPAASRSAAPGPRQSLLAAPARLSPGGGKNTRADAGASAASKGTRAGGRG